MEQDALKHEMLTFLKDNFIMSIAVCNENKPSSSVLIYYVDEELNFYFTTHSDSHKAKMLKANPRISLSVWEDRNMLIQADGYVDVVTNQDDRNIIMDNLAESIEKGKDFWPPLLRMGNNNYIVFKIKPYWVRKLDLNVETMTQEESPFNELVIDKNAQR
jgi:nitroimidazol reductase NimA-like FMN-containing flavoprotein (pyridoxamine 5'-phosphate oxidase superfamily)